MKNPFSLVAFALVFVSISVATLVYYPKWKEPNREKVISWDVAGYYQYLPALIIYKDLKKVSYIEAVNEKYRFTPGNESILPLPNGNRVMKYAMGQAVMYSPFFLAAHFYAKNSDYPADGFSIPYQLAIEIEILFFALLGLWVLRLILLQYFSDVVSAITIIGIGLATNYFEYASVTGAMTHNNLFALYALLIYGAIQFYKKPSFSWATLIGVLLGLMALTRPTEVIAVLIPVCWGLNFPIKKFIITRWNTITTHFSKYAVMAFLAILIGGLQLLYWKYVSGDWLVYSYGEEGFDWFSPHLEDCLISMKAGWFVYSPIMILSIIGFYFLYKNYSKLFPLVLLVSLIAMYIAFSWQTWWYGGSLGQRALIQYYPLLAFPFAAFVAQMIKSKWTRLILGGIFAICLYYNIWLSHQVHKGGLVFVTQMTRAYFWKVVGRFEKNVEDLKLLDTDEYFSGDQHNARTLFFNDFENEEIPMCHYPPINGQKSFCMSKINPESPEYKVNLKNGEGDWVRMSASFFAEYPVWGDWAMGLLKIRFYHQGHLIKERMIRTHRLLKPGQVTPIFFDVKCPKTAFDSVSAIMNHGDKGNLLVFDDLKLEVFNEK